MNVKYAVIGFGGAGVFEEAHVKSYNKDSFGNLRDALTIIKSMKFNGQEENSNDAYMAISEAAQLPFRPGASRVFILFNANKHTAHKLGSTIDEAKYALEKEVDAALVTFESVDFKNKKKVIGQSTRKLYTHKKTVSGKFKLPESKYSKLVEDTEGGIFYKDIKNVPKTVKAVYDITDSHIRKNVAKCRRCKVVPFYDHEAKTVCQP